MRRFYVQFFLQLANIFIIFADGNINKQYEHLIHTT